MGGVLVEGIETSTFDPLENYISEVTYRREMEKKKDRQSLRDVGEVGEGDGCVNGGQGALRVDVKQQSCDPLSSAQQSDSEVESRTAVVGVEPSSTPEFTPDSSPPLCNSVKDGPTCSPEKPLKPSTVGNHPLEMQQFANGSSSTSANNDTKNTSSTSYFTETQASTERSFDNDLNASAVSSRPVKSQDSNIASTSVPWFSLLPRKQCEVLHYLQLDPGQQQGVMMAPQFLGGSGYAYISPGNAVLGQPVVQQVQMGYALMGNNLVQVPQTQYVMAGQTGSTVGAGNQLISLGNGQYALAPAAASGGVQYVSINGNQYAIMQAPDQQEVKPDEAVAVPSNSLNIGSIHAESQSRSGTQSHSSVPLTQSLGNVGALKTSSTQEITGSKEENHKAQNSSSSGTYRTCVVTVYLGTCILDVVCIHCMARTCTCTFGLHVHVHCSFSVHFMF